jgi:hypothetical protein
MGRITIICAWCERIIGYKSYNSRDDIVSHGICPDCKDKITKEASGNPLIPTYESDKKNT